MPKGHEKDPSKTSPTTTPDPIKDSKDITNILNILDSHAIRTNPFGANVSGENSYRRAERICAALHLVTNHVPVSEPLRTSVRDGGLNLLNVLLELRTGMRGPASEKGQEALASIRSLVSFVRLLAIAGYISPSNAGALAEALDELGVLVSATQRSALAEQLTIARDDLVPPSREDARAEPPRPVRSPAHRSRQPAAPVNAPSEVRGGQIMDILKAGGLLSIKDIAANLPQYSEKMVQRELAALSQAGRVKKIGAKRWSRYQAT